MTLTAVVLTKNEQNSLSDCLATLNFCDSVVVLDDFSTDDTPKIAKKFKATVLQHRLDADFSAQRNWGLDQVKSPWVLFIDADEQVSPALASEITSAITKPEYKGFYLKRIDYLWGKQLRHGDVGDVKFLRLARRGVGQWHGKVHEKWSISDRTSTLTNPLNHYPHPKFEQFLRHINHYSTLKADEFYASNKKTNILEITLGPIYRFAYSYFFKAGFLDGTAGFVHSMTMAFYMFLVAGKLYLLGKGIPPKHV